MPRPIRNIEQLEFMRDLWAMHMGQQKAVRTFRNKYTHLHERTAYSYWKHVVDEAAEVNPLTTAKRLPALRARLHATNALILQRSIASGDNRAAITASQEIAKLYGAHAPAKLAVQHDGSIEQNINVTITLTTGEQRRELGELMSRFLASATPQALLTAGKPTNGKANGEHAS